MFDLIVELENKVKELQTKKFEINDVKSIIEENVNTALANKPQNNNTNSTIFISDELEDRLKVMEENIFKLMSGSLAPQENPVKKQKTSKVSVCKEEQLALFPTEKVDFSSIEEKKTEESEDLVIENKPKETVEIKIQENENLPQEVVNTDETGELVNDEPIQEVIEVKEEKVYSDNPFDKNGELAKTIIARERKRREKVDPNADLFALFSQSLQSGKNEEIKDVPTNQKDELSPAEKALNSSATKFGEHKITANSELVRTPKREDDLYFAPYKNSETPVENKKASEQPKEIDVKCDGYDVKTLERILHDSRSEEARNERSRITSLWQFLPSLAPSDKRGIAETLAEGVINAVGKNEFVITYPSAAICNQIMNPRFKKEALKLLYEMLETEYDYLALPINVWTEKRTEYINQYNIGIKYPKLTPFNNPELVISAEKKVVNKEELMVEKVRGIFGDSLVTIDDKEK